MKLRLDKALAILLCALFLATPSVFYALPEGEKFILDSFKESRPLWLFSAYQNLVEVWKAQADDENLRNRISKIRPFSDEYFNELKLRYGLFQKPEVADPLPYGITFVKRLGFVSKILFPGVVREPIGIEKGQTALNLNCFACHGRVIPTESGTQFVVGIGNSHFDFQRLHEDLSLAAGTHKGELMKRNPHRNSYASGGDALAELVNQVRADDDTYDAVKLYSLTGTKVLKPKWQELHDYMQTLPLMKTPAWSTFGDKKKAGVKGGYADGSWKGGFEHVLAGMMISNYPDGRDYKKYRVNFKAYGMPYIESLKSPKYPWKDSLSAKDVEDGHIVFEKTCSKCHGSYTMVIGNSMDFARTSYPGKLVSLEFLKTDSRRAIYSDELIIRREKAGRVHHIMGEKERGGTGYVAPPLDGIWARAPYFHNGSVPYLSQVTNSKNRFTVFASDLSVNDPTVRSGYDSENGGWRVDDYSQKSVSEIKSEISSNPYLRVFDPRLLEVKAAGLSNTGHPFGDHLDSETRRKLIAFLLSI